MPGERFLRAIHFPRSKGDEVIDRSYCLGLAGVRP